MRKKTGHRKKMQARSESTLSVSYEPRTVVLGQSDKPIPVTTKRDSDVIGARIRHLQLAKAVKAGKLSGLGTKKFGRINRRVTLSSR
jgi:hypothetical protein